MRRQTIFRSFCKVALIGLLTVSVQAQQADALKLTVTEGVPAAAETKAGAKKKESVAGPVIVEVRDDSGRIVPGARVQVNTPASAARPILGWTDTEGRAYIDGVIPPGQEGKVPITADARFNGKLGSTVFNNTAMAPAPPEIVRMFTFQKPSHKLRNTLIIAGVVGITALAIALALTLPGGAAKVIPPPPTTVSVGGVTVGSPQ
jgi:hypothetical protein